jgi:Ca2+-binding EF-hand superfamily protein
MLIAGLVSTSFAGHNYHGYGMKMSEMSEMDRNNDGEITFDEFSAPATERLKSGFKMLDINNDDIISQEEWDEFLRAHGFEEKSEG